MINDIVIGSLDSEGWLSTLWRVWKVTELLLHRGCARHCTPYCAGCKLPNALPVDREPILLVERVDAGLVMRSSAALFSITL